VDLAFDARARIHAGDGSAAADAWYHELADVRDVATRTFVAADGVLAADSPRGLRELLAAYAEVGVDELVAGYLGERPAFSFEKTALRRVPPAPATSWHQDGAFLGGAGIRSLNVWVALSSCGRTSPGLEILPRRVEHIVRLGGMFDWDIADETLAREFPGEPPVLIEFEPGDALLFDHLCVHRTGQIRGMTEPRYALESWFFSPSRFPEVLTGLLW
jgi:ectoine hydroxylase-related dioxygenase (phytanoyl-CoA dioxygenase family)